jgi:hypothetical protein
VDKNNNRFKGEKEKETVCKLPWVADDPFVFYPVRMNAQPAAITRSPVGIGI